MSLPHNSKDIPGYVGKYGVTADGRVFSYGRGRYMNLATDNGGYSIFRLRSEGKLRRYGVARLVYSLHVGPIAKGNEIDHINGIQKDNAVDNLRETTRSQNMANTRKRRGSKSIYKGVCWHKHKNKWLARIRHNYQWYYLGYFDDEEQAAIAYDAAAHQLFGEYALTNCF